jgi:hypothetical protein
MPIFAIPLVEDTKYTNCLYLSGWHQEGIFLSGTDNSRMPLILFAQLIKTRNLAPDCFHYYRSVGLHENVGKRLDLIEKAFRYSQIDIDSLFDRGRQSPTSAARSFLNRFSKVFVKPDRKLLPFFYTTSAHQCPPIVSVIQITTTYGIWSGWSTELRCGLRFLVDLEAHSVVPSLYKAADPDASNTRTGLSITACTERIMPSSDMPERTDTRNPSEQYTEYLAEVMRAAIAASKTPGQASKQCAQIAREAMGG